jgi:hypothetical protein
MLLKILFIITVLYIKDELLKEVSKILTADERNKKISQIKDKTSRE